MPSAIYESLCDDSTVIMMAWLLVFSLVSTVGAVVFGVLAYRAERRASPVDLWSAGPRTGPISQADRLRTGLERDVHRNLARSRTYVAGLWWLAAGCFSSAASIMGATHYGFEVLGSLLVAGAVILLGWSSWHDSQRRSRGEARIAKVRELIELAKRPDRTPLMVSEQLAEWTGNADLRVFVQHRLAGPTSTTYQGILSLVTTGIGGWHVDAFDRDLGPADSASVFRGVALNLHQFSSEEWNPGNGIFGARCRFTRRGIVPIGYTGGQVLGGPAILETLVIAIDDAFEIMPFLGRDLKK